jgi:hypothetical protein
MDLEDLAKPFETHNFKQWFKRTEMLAYRVSVPRGVRKQRSARFVHLISCRCCASSRVRQQIDQYLDTGPTDTLQVDHRPAIAKATGVTG